MTFLFLQSTETQIVAFENDFRKKTFYWIIFY